MIEKDTLQELFSKAFENQTASVKPELWAGVQAKMGVTAGASVAAAKGVSILAKWMIGAASVSVVGVVTALVVTSNSASTVNKNTPQSTIQPSENTSISKQQTPIDNTTIKETIQSTQVSNTPIKTEQVVETSSIPKEQIHEESIFDYIPPTIVSQKLTENHEIKKETPVIVPSIKKEIPTVFPETSEPVAAPISAKSIRFPNVFTPNGDGTNDFYFIEAENVTDLSIQILNSNNQVVFRTNDIRFKWDGQSGGERVPSGMYACIVVGKDAQQKEFRDIQLIEIR